jgi:PTS system mannose-specific IIA component
MKVIESIAAKPEPGPSIGGVIVTHGHLGNEFLAAAEMIVGPIANVTAASIEWHDDVEVAREELERAIARVARGRGVLLLTDTFGGAATNVASMFLGDEGIEVVTGVNLPMIIKLAEQKPEERLSEMAARVRDAGNEGIFLASDLLPRSAKSE